jgi:hypothetical protein
MKKRERENEEMRRKLLLLFSSYMLVVNPLISKQDRTIREQSASLYNRLCQLNLVIVVLHFQLAACQSYLSLFFLLIIFSLVYINQ